METNEDSLQDIMSDLLDQLKLPNIFGKKNQPEPTIEVLQARITWTEKLGRLED